MALLAGFIGVDRHADPGIRELRGARRDAVALHALFVDSVPGIEAHLLVDEQATAAGVRQLLNETLGAAGPDDTVLLAFSGHGSPDHRLVAYDTALQDLPNTSIPMAEVAARFQNTLAKAVICVLDCCFSGGAPARVLEDVPLTRDVGLTLESVAGTGRILLAAAHVDEVALEHPTRRHGLLTQALIDALTAAEGPVGVSALTEAAMERVRADAARLGYVQTPVLFGVVEGGLVLPPLRPGRVYFAAFPEQRGARVGTAIAELAAFGIPAPVLDAWVAQFPGGLNALQLAAVNDHRVLDGASLLVVAPTSAGKTFVGEMAAASAVAEGRKAVFLLPYRALVNEKFDQFGALYSDALGMRVVRCTGDYADQVDPFVRGRYDLALLTYEMFLNLVLGVPGLLHQIGLVVLDEAQFITDPNRGITVELLLTYLLTQRESGVAPQVVALSAVIGDVNRFDEWLGCGALVTTERPVPLTEGVLDRAGLYQYRDPASGEVRTEQLLPAHAIQMRHEKASAQDVIVPLVRRLVDEGQKVIVFRNMRGPARGCAAYLAKELGLPPAREALTALPTHDLSSTSNDLRFCLNGGTAFHTTDLTREERTVVERAFRDPAGPVRVLAATTTVAAGINTPASTVILAEQEFVGEDGRPFTIAEYKNMAGRAGRLGFNEEGRAIVLADNAYERKALLRRYVLGQPEQLRSSFDTGHLDTWIVRLLVQAKRVLRADVPRLLANTYGGYLASRDNPGWQQDAERRIDALLTRMIELGLAEEEQGYVQLTLLGRACGRSALSFASALRLVEMLRAVPPAELTAERLMALVQALPEADNGYTPVFKKGAKESARQAQAAQRFGAATVRVLQRYVSDQYEYYGRCKRAAILWDWIAGVPIEAIEQGYSTTPHQGRIGYGDVRRFVDTTRFHLRSAHEIAFVMFPGEGPDQASVDALLRRLEVGLPADALELLDLPLALGRGEYLALRTAGVRSVADLWAQPRQRVDELLGSARAAQLDAVRPKAAPAPHVAA